MHDQDWLDRLTGLVEAERSRSNTDPFGNPMLSVSLQISRLIDRGELDPPTLAALVANLRDRAFAARARRLAAYVGGLSPGAAEAAMRAVAARLIRPERAEAPIPFAEFRALAERPRFAAVFTAHPTFAHPPAVYRALAEAAETGAQDAAPAGSHRPPALSLEDEFAEAVAAIGHGRDALDRLTLAFLREAETAYGVQAATLRPCPVLLASWVGYDTDGRTDIECWDTLRLRLRMKHLQLCRVVAQLAALQLAGLDGTAALQAPLAAAAAMVARQIEAAPQPGQRATPAGVAAFAHAIVDGRETALVSLAKLAPLFDAAIAAAPPAHRLPLSAIRAGLFTHGLSLAHTHVRLNAAQLHNMARQLLNLTDPPEDPARRRALLAAMNTELEKVTPARIDFGAVLAEKSSAVRLMMTIAQIRKHIDADAPVRFLVAETETGYTLLATLYLARLFGVENAVEISPLFETAEALESGARVLDEALRSPAYRAYLAAAGRLCLQFGYSDSGRYVGQIAASYLIERLRLKIAETLARHNVRGVEVVLFDTHGESIGRGAHPGSLTDRLKYLAPTRARRVLGANGISVREESAFQGGDGYLLFGSTALATATVARIAEHAFAVLPPPGSDPVYWDPDFAADFFAAIGQSMQALVEDPGYAALLGAFGPSLLDRTGSRPAARQTEGFGPPSLIRHPRALRAIPNNAVLQQLGWCANTLQGLGAAAERHAEAFLDLKERSRRFGRALDFAAHALAHSDLDVLRAVVTLFDASTWLDRASHARFPPDRRAALIEVAQGVAALGVGAAIRATFQRIQEDDLALRGVWPGAPRMAPEECLLHALRIALISRIWLLETKIPDFAPRNGVTRADIRTRLLRLEVEPVLAFLASVFPAAADPAEALDYAEPPPERRSGSYAREHATVFTPMREAFDLIREIGTAVSHANGAFG